MSGEKFTKGEWAVTGTENTFVYCLNNSDQNAFSLNVDGNGKKGASAKEREANAHLIAAAPEMYAMLETMSKFRDSFSADELVQYFLDNSDDIESLLAKARGENV